MTGHQLLLLIIKVMAQCDSTSLFLLRRYHQDLAPAKLMLKHSLLLLTSSQPAALGRNCSQSMAWSEAMG